jgi:putative peptidoglycan lipid II flippase
MYRNIFLVGGWTIASRLTGFLRDIALAALMGGGALNDAYVAAIKLPNQFRQIFGEGSFNAAYLPTYTRVLEASGPEEAGRFASQVFTLLILSQIALLGLVYLDMPLLVRLTSPGFVSQPEKFAQAVAMSRIMFPYIAFIAVFALHQGTLNANNAWGSPAFAPAAANVCMIAFLSFAAFFPKLSPGVASMASWGFLASGATQLAIVMADARRRGLLERLTWPRWTPDIRRFFWMLGPAIGISASYQIGALADQIVGSLLPTGGLSAISYADRLYQLPGGVIVIATGSVLLREMSALVALGDERGALAAQNRAASLTLALGAPFVVAFLLIPDLIIAVAFERGAFTANATHQAAGVLAAYALGMPALLVDRITSATESSRS